jgi:hypothetical protein
MIKFSVALFVLLTAATIAERVGADFFVVGDFGWVRNMTDPNSVFDALDRVKANALPDSNDDA